LLLKTITRFATIGVRDFQRVIAGLSATASDSGNEGHRGGTAAANGRDQFLSSRAREQLSASYDE